MVKRKQGHVLLVIFCLLGYLSSCHSYWQFPGMSVYSVGGQEGDKIFRETMKSLLQPRARCNPKENSEILKKLYEWIKSQNDIHMVQKKVLSYKEKLCRFDVTTCDEAQQLCTCNGNTQLSEKSDRCQIRVGWPCTEGEQRQPGQCMKGAACRPWPGSYNYDTETFPRTTDFFTDPVKFYCRCAADSPKDCGDLGDEVALRAQTPSFALSWNINNNRRMTLLLSIFLVYVSCYPI